ncbi:MAG: helicase RepA family protein [Gemmataceae bacterium]|nr:helicase RepA family protein [Gemmataceae bacterium]
MLQLNFNPRPLGVASPAAPAPAVDWVWDGYLARRNLTLLTSRWKAGKTTLLAGLLRAMADGAPFLGRPTAAGHALVVTEEDPDHWAYRSQAIPVGPHARVVSRPFLTRPTVRQWYELAGRVKALRAAGPVDLLVVDPLATFLPGKSDSDPSALNDFLTPLRILARGGTAVLVLHHPRKARSEEGSAARGSGALLGAVDVVLELSEYGPLATDQNRRKLTGRGRLPGVPRVLAYEWEPGTPEFRAVPDPTGARFRDNWEAVRGLLAGRRVPATHGELLADWPGDRPRPAGWQLYDWLARAAANGLAVRTGGGTRNDPYRFAVPGKGVTRLPDLPPLD